MNKENLSERFLRIIMIDNEFSIDVNDNDTIWEKITNQKNKIIKIKTDEWEWNLSTGEIVLFLQ